MIQKNRKNLLLLVITTIIITVLSIQMIAVAEKENSKAKDPEKKDIIQELTMEDIHGKEVHSKELMDSIIIYSFGDRKSNEPLQEAVVPAGKKTLKVFPDLKMAYINVADLQLVPYLFRYIVKPILRYIYKSNMEELKEQYEKEGLDYNNRNTIYHLVPDWSGDLCKAFYIEDAKEWKCFITYKNKIYTTLDKDTENFEEKFLKTIKGISGNSK